MCYHHRFGYPPICILHCSYIGNQWPNRCKFANIRRCFSDIRLPHKAPYSHPPNRCNHDFYCIHYQSGCRNLRCIRTESMDRKSQFCLCNFSRHCHPRILLSRYNTNDLKYFTRYIMKLL